MESEATEAAGSADEFVDPDAVTPAELAAAYTRAQDEIHRLRAELSRSADLVAASAELVATLEEAREWEGFQRAVELVAQRAGSVDALLAGVSQLLCDSEMLPVQPYVVAIVGGDDGDATRHLFGPCPEGHAARVDAALARQGSLARPVVEDDVALVPLLVGGESVGTLALHVTPGGETPDYWLPNLSSPAAHCAASLHSLRAQEELRAKGRELAEARDEALAAARTKSEFLANMSHELRTPLNGILGYTELILDDIKDESYDEIGRFASSVKLCGNSLLELINDLLDFTKIESGHMELEAIRFDVRGVVEDALDVVASAAARKGIELAFEVDPSVPPALVGDPTRVRQTLLNLVSNAIKFTAQGEVIVTVSARTSATPAGMIGSWFELQVSVSDTGIGIPPGRTGRLFQPFTQADTSATRKYGGTGLGLAICKRLVEMMRGRIWVDSEEGVGSTFTFTIRAPAARARTSGPLPSAGALAGRTILIADDSGTSAAILQRLVARWRMRARVVAPGELLNLCAAEGLMPDAIVLGGVHRRSLAEQLRTRHDAGELALVVMETLGSTGAGSLEPAHTVIKKPVKPDMLFAALSSTLAARGEPIPAVPPAAEEGVKPPLRILLVDDNRVNREVAHLALCRLGYQPDIAIDGVEAVEVALRRPYDVVLMDVQMPRMDGIEATRRIRASRGHHAQPKIIAVTANSTVRDRERCLAAGMNDFLSKPFSIHRLATALERCMAVA